MEAITPEFLRTAALTQLHYEIRRTEWVLHYWSTLTPEEQKAHDAEQLALTIPQLQERLRQLRAKVGLDSVASSQLEILPGGGGGSRSRGPDTVPTVKVLP